MGELALSYECKHESSKTKINLISLANAEIGEEYGFMIFQKPWLCGLFILWLVGCGLISPAQPVSAQQYGATLTRRATGDELWDNRFVYPGIEGKVQAVAVAANGDLYVGGDFRKAGGVEVSHVARWDGRTWHALQGGVNGPVTAIAVDGDAVYVAGDFTTAGDLNASGLAQWNGTAWSHVGSGVGPVDDYFGSVEIGDIYALAVADHKLYIGGDFVTMDGVAANSVAVWDGQGWAALGDGVGKRDWEDKIVPEGVVRALLPYSDALYVGGDFTVAGGLAANNIAAWSGREWVTLGAGLTLDENSSFSYPGVAALAVYNGQVHAGGAFTRSADAVVPHLGVWDGTAWKAVGGGVLPKQYASDTVVNALTVSGDRLFVGGSFVSAGGKKLELLVQWDGAAFSLLGEGIQILEYEYVFALAPAADGGVYIGGTYRFADNLYVNNIALWRADTWQVLGAGLTQGAYGDTPAHTYAIAVDDEGRVFVGGDFEYAGGVKVDNLAMWDGTGWQSLGGVDARVRAMAIAGDDLYVAGEFTQAGGRAANHIARWNRTTGQWSPLGGGINGEVNALVYSNGRLYVGGSFTAAGNVTAYDVAFWDGEQWHPFGTKAKIYERTQEGGEYGTQVRTLAVAGDLVFIGGIFQTIHYGQNFNDLKSYVVMHNLTAWDSAKDEWFWVGTPLNPGVSNQGQSGYKVQAKALALIGNMLYVGGEFNQAGAVAANNLARYNLATGEWSGVDNSVGGLDEAMVHTLAVYGTDLYVGGHFTAAGTTPARFVARYATLTDSWSALGSGLSWYNDFEVNAYTIATSAQGIYVGGSFTAAGGRPAPGFARWDAGLPQGDVTPDAGGVIDGPEGLQAQFPAGATDEPLVVRLTALAGPRQPLPTDHKGVRSFNSAASTVTGEAVTTLQKAYTLRIPYTEAQLAAAGITDPTKLNVMRWNGAAWTPLLPCTGCGVDTAAKVVTVAADHLGEFALVGPASTPNPPPGNKQLFLPVVRS
jgi:trimeric autotransporter adhesin